MKEVRILAIGDNVCDKYLSRGKMYPGGQCVNTCAYARMNQTEAAYLGKFGSDEVAAYNQEILARLRNGETPVEAESHSYDSWHRGTRYTYAVPISDSQELDVEVIVDGEEYEILRWQAQYTGEWETVEGLDLWDGTLFE